MKMLHMISYLLVWFGGLNWGLVGLFDYNLVDTVLGGTGLAKVAYILVGLATIYTIYGHITTKECRVCSPSKR